MLGRSGGGGEISEFKKRVRDLWDEFQKKAASCEGKVDPTLPVKEQAEQFKTCMRQPAGFEETPKISLSGSPPLTKEERQRAQAQITHCRTEAAKALSPESKKAFEEFCYRSLPPRDQEAVKVLLQGAAPSQSAQSKATRGNVPPVGRTEGIPDGSKVVSSDLPFSEQIEGGNGIELAVGLPTPRLEVPFHPAKRQNYCTVACLSMVLDYYGIDPLPDQDLLHERCPYFEACDINPLREYGLEPYMLQLAGIEDLQREFELGNPIILRIKNPRTHSIVGLAVEAKKGVFIYNDPAKMQGGSMMSFQKLMEEWDKTGMAAMIFDSTARGTIAMSAPEPVTNIEGLPVAAAEYLWTYAPKAREVLLCITATVESGPLREREILARAARTMSKKAYRQALHLLLHPILFQLKEAYRGKDIYPVVLVERRSIEARRDARAEYSLTTLARKVVQVLRDRGISNTPPDDWGVSDGSGALPKPDTKTSDMADAPISKEIRYQVMNQVLQTRQTPEEIAQLIEVPVRYVNKIKEELQNPTKPWSNVVSLIQARKLTPSQLEYYKDAEEIAASLDLNLQTVRYIMAQLSKACSPAPLGTRIRAFFEAGTLSDQQIALEVDLPVATIRQMRIQWTENLKKPSPENIDMDQFRGLLRTRRLKDLLDQFLLLQREVGALKKILSPSVYETRRLEIIRRLRSQGYTTDEITEFFSRLAAIRGGIKDSTADGTEGKLTRAEKKAIRTAALILESKSNPLVFEVIAEMMGEPVAYVQSLHQELQAPTQVWSKALGFVLAQKLTTGEIARAVDTTRDYIRQIQQVAFERLTRIYQDEEVPFNLKLYGLQGKNCIYLYNHYQTLKDNHWIGRGTGLEHDTVLESQLQQMPRTYFLYSHPTHTIFIVDPIGQMQPNSEHPELFNPHYDRILRQYVEEIKFVEYYEASLQRAPPLPMPPYGRFSYFGYNLKIILTHAHPDHTTGLTLLLDQLHQAGYRKPIELLVPAGLPELLRDYKTNLLGPENVFVQDRLGWTAAFINSAREVCDLFAGKYRNWDDLFLQNLRQKGVTVTEVPGSYDIDDSLRLTTTDSIHGGPALLFTYTHTGIEAYHWGFLKRDAYFLFLDDLFMLGFALSTCLPPTTSIDKLLAFFAGMRLPDRNTFCLWSHFYPRRSFIEPIKLPGETIEKGSPEPMDYYSVQSYVDSLKDYLDAFYSVHYASGRLKHQDFASLFRFFVKDAKIAPLILEKFLSRVGEENNLIREELQRLLKFAGEAEVRVSFLEDYEENHAYIAGIRLEGGTIEEKPFNSHILRSVIYFITVVLNILDWCETRFQTEVGGAKF